MPEETEVTPQASLALAAEKVPSEQGDTILLTDDPRTYVYNIAFDESQHKVFQPRIAHIPNGHASPTNFKDWMIVSYVRRHSTSLADPTKAYAEAMS